MQIFDILFIGWTFIPFVAIGLCFVLLAVGKKKYKSMPLAVFHGLIFSAVFTLLVSIYCYWSAFTKDYNIAPLVIPIFGIIAAFCGFVMGWSFSNLIFFVLALIRGDRANVRNIWTIIRAALSTGLLLTIITGVVKLGYREFQLNKATCYADVEGLRQIFVDAKNKDDIEILKSLAENKKCPPDILEELSNHKSSLIRWGVALNPATPLKIVYKLSNDQDEHVRYGVACNEHTTADILRKLSEDDFRSVRIRVATHSNTPVDILQKLMRDNHWAVRRHVALNPHVTEEILSVLRQDPNENVRKEATSR